MTTTEIREEVEALGEEVCILPEAYDVAITGYFYDTVTGCYRVSYDRNTLMHAVCVENDSFMADAVEWFDRHIVGEYMNPAPPAYLEAKVTV